MQFGIDSFVATTADPETGATRKPVERVRDLLEEIEQADHAGLDTFGIGEHHREEFLDSAPAVLLAAAAARTTRIRLNSAVSVLSAADPVRVFQEFATLDLISAGRAELVVGRGSFGEAYPLFGFDVADYDSLFAEKLELLLKIRAGTHVKWSGKHRPALTGQGVYPRPVQTVLPIWVGVGGSANSFVRAGLLGLPLMIAIIGGPHSRFRPLIDLYREAGRKAGHPADRLKVAIHTLGYVAETQRRAQDEFFPGYAAEFGRIGRERGWSRPTREQFDAECTPSGSLLVGNSESVAAKVVAINHALGGIDRITFQMSVAALPHARALRAIELIGSQVKPRVNGAAPIPVSADPTSR